MNLDEAIEYLCDTDLGMIFSKCDDDLSTLYNLFVEGGYKWMAEYATQVSLYKILLLSFEDDNLSCLLGFAADSTETNGYEELAEVFDLIREHILILHPPIYL